jgi:16S rRNA (adenine1518-N6/adenine1519-N6)-dimethyltransferase
MRLGPAGFKPKRRWGQNFLVDPGALAAIAAAFCPTAGDRVLEIGPGDGALTRRIAPRVASLLAVEVDPALAAALRIEFADRVRVVEGDVLAFDPEKLLADAGAAPGRPVRLFGNLPYNIATAVILKYLRRHDLVRDLMVMVQREVAERILAPPRSKEYGSLTVLCRSFAKVERIRRLRPGSFRPRPKVESEVIRLALRDPGGASGTDPGGYGRFVQDCFGQRRKTFLNNLTRVLAAGGAGEGAHERARALLEAAAIDPGGRPEEVSPEGFERLFAGHKSWPEKRIGPSPAPV